MIVVSGEALMDVFDAGATATGQALDARLGGSPFNVAVGLARLGRPVAFFGGLGRGFLGDRLARALADEGVDLRCVQRLDAPTTLGLVGLDAHGVADYAFYGQGAADRLLTPAALDAVPAAAVAYHVGSYALVVEPTGSTLRALVAREHRRSVVACDVNVRLNVEPDLDTWRQCVQWMAAHVSLLKLSDEDFDRLYPGASPDAQAAAWRAQGVDLVVMTRGAQGAWAWSAHGRHDVAPVPVTLVDTVGAGDTFQAALLTALAERGLLTRAALAALDTATLAAVLGFAARAAALTCGRRGADLPRRAELA